MGGEGSESKEAEADCIKPIGQRGLFKIADAVDLERDPVSARQDVARGVGVGGIGVVEERRREKGSEKDCGPEAGENP